MAVTVRGFYAYPPPGHSFNVSVKSSDESVISITPEAYGGGGVFTIHANGVGTAYITSATDPTQTYITVHVFACVPVSIHPLASPLVVKPGSHVELRVITQGFQTVSREWLEEVVRHRNYTPVSDSAGAPLPPPAAGTCRLF